MKVFLIGKNGQLGHELDILFRLKKYNVVSFGSKDLNILDYSEVRKKIKKYDPDIVINTAAYHIISECEKFPQKAFALNASSQKNIADICNEQNIQLIYYSTDRVFDGATKRPYKEADYANPIQIYGISKLAGELVAKHYNENSIVIRTCGIFGGIAGSREKKGNFVLYILRQAKKTELLEVSSEQVSSFTYAKDLAIGTLSLLEKKIKKGTYNIVNEKYSSWANFANEIVRMRDLKLKIKPIDRRGIHNNIPTPTFTALDTSKIKSIGIILPTWQDGLKRYLDFLQKNGI